MPFNNYIIYSMSIVTYPQHVDITYKDFHTHRIIKQKFQFFNTFCYIQHNTQNFIKFNLFFSFLSYAKSCYFKMNGI